MKPIFALALLGVAVSAHAADHRLAFSQSENVEVFVEHADGQAWCSDNLKLRFAFGSETPDAAAVGRLLPKLGGLIGNQCAAANQLTWYSQNKAGQQQAKGNAAKTAGWQAQVEAPAVAAIAPAPTPVPTPAQAPVVAPAAVAEVVAPVAAVAPVAPVAAVEQPAPAAEAAPVAAAPQAEAKVEEAKVAAPATPVAEPVSTRTDFAVNGWQPKAQSEVLASAGFLTEITDQNGCRFRLNIILEDGVENTTAQSTGVTCGADGYAQGKGDLSISRRDGRLLHRVSDDYYLSGLPMSSEPPQLPVVGFDKRNNMLLLLHSEPSTKVHYLLHIDRNYNGSWSPNNAMVVAVTENVDLFRDLNSIRPVLDLAAAQLIQKVPNLRGANFYAFRDLEKGLLEGERDAWLYQIHMDRHYRAKDWNYNPERAENYLFAFERREAERLRREQEQREREEQMQREIAARQAEQQLQVYRQLRRETRKPEELYQRISQDASFSLEGGSYDSMLSGRSVNYSQVIYIDGKADGGWEVEYPYQAIINADDSDYELNKGWFLVKGQASLDLEEKDDLGLPMTLITASSVLACTEDECADLLDPLTLMRHELGQPDWTPEEAKELIKQAWPDRAVSEGDDQ